MLAFKLTHARIALYLDWTGELGNNADSPARQNPAAASCENQRYFRNKLNTNDFWGKRLNPENSALVKIWIIWIPAFYSTWSSRKLVARPCTFVAKMKCPSYFLVGAVQLGCIERIAGCFGLVIRLKPTGIWIPFLISFLSTRLCFVSSIIIDASRVRN